MNARVTARNGPERLTGGPDLANPAAPSRAGANVAVAGLMFDALYALTGRLGVPIGPCPPRSRQ